MKEWPVSHTARSKTAVCVLRVERQDENGILITVTTTFDVSLTSSRRTQKKVASAEKALSLVAGFLLACERGEDFSAES
jgi:hypothetical protein